MSHFAKDKTETELFIINNFNYKDNSDYTKKVMQEGKFITISALDLSEDEDANTIPAPQELPPKQ
jgi:hypothetical protein